MPSRWQCVLIVVFWLAVTGWLYVRELQSLFREHDPPPYVIDLTAETQFVHPRVVWKVFQNNQEEECYLVKTWMDHTEEDDSFTLHATKSNPRAAAERENEGRPAHPGSGELVPRQPRGTASTEFQRRRRTSHASRWDSPTWGSSRGSR